MRPTQPRPARTTPAPTPTAAPPPRQRRRAGTVLTGLACSLLLAVGATALTPAPPASSRQPDPKVFAHYFPPYPISIDNAPTSRDYYARNYLDPEGEGGIHADYGGLLRDRPQPEQSRSGSWEMKNQKTEIAKAKRAGLDGFMVDLLSKDGRNWESSVRLTRAAGQAGDFTVVPMVDATASFAEQSPSAAAKKIAVLLHSSAAYRTPTGYLLSSFAAERKPVSWWRETISTLERRHRLPISFQAVFLSASDHNMKAFSGIADSYGNWGTRTVRSVQRAPNYAKEAHSRGKTWIAPVAMQDYRPSSETYAEAKNTATFRAMWSDARSDGADMVQVATWNDYSESTQIAPSRAHSSCFVDLNDYYSHWFSKRKQPRVGRDAIMITHRIQDVGAKPKYRHELASPDLGGAKTDPRNRVEVLVMAKKKATVVTRVGGRTFRYPVKPGVQIRSFRLRPGVTTVKLERGGYRVRYLESKHRVVTRPYVQDLQYYATCTDSLRSTP